MDISYLSDFVILSEELNYSRTAQRRHISQPALSNHIQALEDDLGVRLFDRTKRHVALTQEGRILLSEAQQISQLFENMHRFNAKNLSDNYVITAGGFLENPEVLGLLVMRIRGFASDTGINVRLLCDYSPFNELVVKLQEKQLDFLVSYPNGDEGSNDSVIGGVPFYCDPFFVAINKDNHLAEREELNLDDLKDLDFVKLASPMFDSGWQQVEHACQVAGYSPKYHSVYVDSIYDCPFIDIGINDCFIIAYGGFSNGVAFHARPDLVLLPLRDECFHIDLFYNKSKIHPLIQQFVDYIRPFSTQEHCD